MKRLFLHRFYADEKKTLGDLTLRESGINKAGSVILMLKTLELPWKDNKPGISCIPTGEYLAKVHAAPKFEWCLWLQNVPGRSEILIHSGNYTSQILGCILPGIIHDDINNDGITDVKHSGVAMEALQFYMKGMDKIIIEIE